MNTIKGRTGAEARHGTYLAAPERRQKRSAQASPRVLLVLLLVVLLPLIAVASAPSWWTELQVLDTGATANDYAAINQGQLKNLAVKANAHLHAKLPTNVWSTTEGVALTTLINTFQTNSAYNYNAVNLGQLKAVAKPFYDVLNSAGYTNAAVASPYPWSNSSTPANDYAMANIGQAKNLFAFDLSSFTPPSFATIPDWWQLQYFGQTGIDPNADLDADGIKNIDEYLQGSDPTNYYSQDSEIIIPVLTIVSGFNQSGDQATCALQPLLVKVKDSAGSNLSNAPVTFTVVGGYAELSYLNSTGSQLYTQVTLRTDGDGIARLDSQNQPRNLYFWFPSIPGAVRQVQVTAGGAIPLILSFTVSVNANNPVITAPATLSAPVGRAYSYTIQASNSPSAYDSTVLPIGLTLHSTSGLISGVPTQVGQYPVTLTATNSSGWGQADVMITVTNASPVITSSLSVTVAKGEPFYYQIEADYNPTTFSAAILPEGIEYDENERVVSGTFTEEGTYTFTVKAENNQGSETKTVTVTVGPALPQINGNIVKATQYRSFSYQILAANRPQQYAVEGLPAGLGINTTSGIISGVPLSTGRSYIPIHLTNASGVADDILIIEISAPSSSVLEKIYLTQGVTVNYPFNPSNGATQYEINGVLPDGLSMDSNSGVISGAPAQIGTPTTTVTVTNSGVTYSGQIQFVILSSNRSVQTEMKFQSRVSPYPDYMSQSIGLRYSGNSDTANGSDAAGQIGVIGDSSASTLSRAILGFDVASLPPDVQVASASLQIYGVASGTVSPTIEVLSLSAIDVLSATWNSTQYLTSTLAGSLLTSTISGNVTLNSATLASTVLDARSNSSALGHQVTLLLKSTGAEGIPPDERPCYFTFSSEYSGTLTQSPLLSVRYSTGAPPEILLPDEWDIAVNTTSTLSIPVWHLPTGFTIGQLPDGLTGEPLVDGVATITGSLNAVTTSNVIITATNANGVGSRTLKIRSVTTPVITSSTNWTCEAGSTASYTITATNSPRTFRAASLPPGFSVDASTGLISGITSTPGIYTATIFAKNVAGEGNAPLTINVAGNQVPVLSVWHSYISASTPFSYAITASQNPTSYNASGLPSGWSIDTATGYISAAAGSVIEGTYTLTLSATNACGTGTAVLPITISAAPKPIFQTLAFEGSVGASFSQYVSVTNSYDTMSVVGLPAGLSYQSGTITGTPLQTGTTTATITATNSYGTTTANAKFIIHPPGPAIYGETNFEVGVGHNANISILGGNDTQTMTISSPLPSGLVFSKEWNSWVITGTTTLSGVYTLSATLTNSNGETNSTPMEIVLTIKPRPAFTSPLQVTATAGQPLTYSLTASGEPAAYTVSTSSLPPGLNYIGSTITGTLTATASGFYAIPVSVSNPVGTTTGSLQILVVPSPNDVVAEFQGGVLPSTAYQALLANISQDSANTLSTSISAQSDGEYLVGRLTETAVWRILLEYDLSSLPDDITITSAALRLPTAILSSTSTDSNTVSLYQAAHTFSTSTPNWSNNNGYKTTALTSYLWNSESTIGVPVFYSTPTFIAAVHQAAQNDVPLGLVLASPGIEQGTLSATLKFSKTASQPLTNPKLTLTYVLVTPTEAPVIKEPLEADGTINQPFAYLIRASHRPSSYTASGLPAGLTLNTTTGQISGTPTAVGETHVTVTAANQTTSGVQTSAPADLVIRVQGATPVARLEVVAGDQQLGLVNTTLSNPLVIHALDANGATVSNALVSFSVPAGNGAFPVANTRTTRRTLLADAQGRATVAFQLPPTPKTAIVTATAKGAIPATFSETSVFYIPSESELNYGVALRLVSGAGQSGPSGQALANPIVVQALNAWGQPLAGKTLQAVAMDGSGAISPASATTDGQGQAVFTVIPQGSENTVNQFKVTESASGTALNFNATVHATAAAVDAGGVRDKTLDGTMELSIGYVQVTAAVEHYPLNVIIRACNVKGNPAYLIYQRKYEDRDWQTISTTSSTEVYDNNLLANRRYQYRVIAVRSQNEMSTPKTSEYTADPLIGVYMAVRYTHKIEENWPDGRHDKEDDQYSNFIESRGIYNPIDWWASHGGDFPANMDWCASVREMCGYERNELSKSITYDVGDDQEITIEYTGYEESQTDIDYITYAFYPSADSQYTFFVLNNDGIPISSSTINMAKQSSYTFSRKGKGDGTGFRHYTVVMMKGLGVTGDDFERKKGVEVGKDLSSARNFSVGAPFNYGWIMSMGALQLPGYYYQLSWDESLFSVYAGERKVHSGETVTFEQWESMGWGGYKIVANENTSPGSSGSLTVQQGLRGSIINTSTVNFIYPDNRDYSMPIDEASGSRYRKIALNGMPMPDGKPQQTEESDQEPEETYVDALTLGLRHSTTDVYLQVPGSDLALSARRDLSSEVWGLRGGLRPQEDPAKPFGVCWSSNLTPSIKFVSSINNPKPGEPDKAYVTDESGATHAFVVTYAGFSDRSGVKFTPMPTAKNQQAPNLESLTVDTTTSPVSYIFKRKYGNTISYEPTDIVLITPDDRLSGSETKQRVSYARARAVMDRLGYALDYHYVSSRNLVPDSIAVRNRPELKLSIQQNEQGLITAIWDAKGNKTSFGYTSKSYASNAGDIRQLTSVTAPDGSVTQYSYDMDSNNLGSDNPELDLTPQDFSVAPHNYHWHCDLKSITDPLHHTYRFAYALDQSKQNYKNDRDGKYAGATGYYVQTGLPRNLKIVTLPDGTTSQFENKSKVWLAPGSDTQNQSLVAQGTRQNVITDASKFARTYTWNNSEVVPVPQVRNMYPETTSFTEPKLIVYKTMTVQHGTMGSEIFEFDLDAAMALSHVKDFSGKDTYYSYTDSWDTGKTSTFRQSLSVNSTAFGRYSDPTTQTNSAGYSRSFTYTSDQPGTEAGGARLMKSVTDEAGRYTVYGFDSLKLGRRISETVKTSENGATVKSTLFAYDNANFPGFMTMRTVSALSGDPSGASSLVTQYVPDSNGRIAQEIVDPSGLHLATSYTYDKNGNKLTATDPKGNTTWFSYDSRNRLTTVTYANGSQKQIVYDLRGNKSVEYDENGHATLRQYDELNRLLKQARHMSGSIALDSTTHAITSIPSTDISTSYTYNAVNATISVTDSRGNCTRMNYDNIQRLLTTTDAKNNVTTFEYGENSGGSAFDSSGFKPTRTVDPRGYVTTVTYDALYRPIVKSAQYSLSPVLYSTTTISYDLVGNPTATIDPLGNRTETDYDALNRPTVTRYAVTTPGQVNSAYGYSQISYTTTGSKWKTRNELGNETETVYDAAGRPTDVFTPAVDNGSGTQARARTQTIYDAAGNVISTINPRGQRWDFAYDARNRKTDEFQPPVTDAITGVSARPHIHTAYDAAGNVTAVTDARGNTSYKLYDAANRPTQTIAAPALTTLANGSTATLCAVFRTDYDPNGNILDTWRGGIANPDTLLNSPNATLTDLVKTAHNTYDTLNRLRTTIDAANILVTNEYDAVGNRTAVIDGKSQRTEFKYDGLNRLTETKDPAAKTVTLLYDAVNKTARIDSNGLRTDYTYDLRNRLTYIAYADNPVYDRTYAYDLVGNLLSVTEQNYRANVAYTYDALNRQLSETSGDLTHQYRYDLAGNRLTTTYGGTGRALVSTYDALNRLQTLTEGGLRTTTYSYDLAGNIVRKTLPNGDRVNSGFDALSRTATLSGASGTNAALYTYTYSYDLASNVKLITEAYPGGVNNRTVANTYDPINRLTNEAITTGGTVVSTTYEYDNAHNRATKTITGGSGAGTTTYTYNNLNQLTATSAGDTYTYDDNGNRLTHTRGALTDTYAYDGENRLVQLQKNIPGDNNITVGAYYYTYDYRTRRVLRTECTSTTYDPEQPPIYNQTDTQVVYSGGTSVQEYNLHDMPEGEGGGMTMMTQTVSLPDPLMPLRFRWSVPDVEYIRGSDYGGGIGGILYTLRWDEPSYTHNNRRGDIIAKTNSTGSLTYQAVYEAYGKRTQESGSTQDRQKANSKDEDPTGLLNEGFRYRDLDTGTFITRDPLGFVDGPNMYAYVVQNPWTKFDPQGLAAADKLRQLFTRNAVKDELKVGDRAVIHAEWAGKTIKPGELPSTIKNKEALAEKYPEGVRYNENGRPDYSPYVDSQSKVKFKEGQLTGNMDADTSAARDMLKSRGLTDSEIASMEKGHTWHHVEGGMEMELVPTDLHDAYRHTGGRADIKAGNWFSRGALAVAGLFLANTLEAQENGGSVVKGAVKDAVNITDAGVVAAAIDTGTAAAHAADQKVNNITSGDPLRVNKNDVIGSQINEQYRQMNGAMESVDTGNMPKN